MANRREKEGEELKKAIKKLKKISNSQKEIIKQIKKTSDKNKKVSKEIKDMPNKYDIYSDVQVGEQGVIEKEDKPIKILKKKMKKQRKILKKLENIVLKNEQAENVEKEEIKNRKIDGVKNYIHKVGEIFLKSLPKILNKVLPLVVGFCLKNCHIWKKKGLIT